MKQEIFYYKEQPISFEVNGNIWVNATEMAKIFSKQVNEFLSNQQTKNFIESILRNGNSRFSDINSEEDLVKTNQRHGTIMHRILALKFAAWLNSDFEVWVYCTIDDLLFGRMRIIEQNLKEVAMRKAKIDELTERLLNNEDYKELEKLKHENKSLSYSRGKAIRYQMDLFKQDFIQI